MTRIACDNCEWAGTDAAVGFLPLAETPRLAERLDAGSEVPAGTCPDCGAFCYITPEKAKTKRLDSVVTEKVELEVGECECGYHFAVDATYLHQVEDFSFKCPSCKGLIETKEIFPE